MKVENLTLTLIDGVYQFGYDVTVKPVKGNRLATAEDVVAFAIASGGEMQVGDVILDTPTNIVLGQKGLYFNNISTHPIISNIRFGGGIWIDSALSPLCYLVLINARNGNVGFVGKSSMDCPIEIEPLHTDGKQLFLSGNTSTNEVLYIAHFAHVLLKFETKLFPGYKWGAGPFPDRSMAVVVNRAFNQSNDNKMTARFELAADNTTKFIGLQGGYFEHGFARPRAGSTNVANVVTKFLFERMVIAPGESEAFYIGMESGSPVPKFETIIMQDIFIVGSGAEAIQIAHLVGGAEDSHIRNIVILLAGMKALNPFGLYQTNGMQLRVGGGNLTVENIVIKGCGEHGIILLNSDQGNGKGLLKLKNIHVEGGMGIGAYIGNVTDGADIEFDGVEFSHMTNQWKQTGLPQKDVIIDGTGNLIDINIHDCKSDGGSFGALESQANNTTNNSIERTRFVNSGLDDFLSEEICAFTKVIGKVYPNAGDYMSYGGPAEVKVVRNPVDGNWYRCIVPYTCDEHSTTPDVDTVHWAVLVWDSKGVRKDQPGYSVSNVPLSYKLPLDLRLVANSYDNIMGRGFNNQDNDDSTVVKWFIADDEGNTINSHRLPAPSTEQLDSERYSQIKDSVGKYLIAEITPRTPVGGPGDPGKVSILIA